MPAGVPTGVNEVVQAPATAFSWIAEALSNATVNIYS